MESKFNRYGAIVGAVGCLFGVLLMYPGNLESSTVMVHRTKESLGIFSYDKNDIQFLSRGDKPIKGYEFRTYIPDSFIAKILGMGITILSAQFWRTCAEDAQRECEESETKENIEKLASLAIFQQKQEAKVYLEAKKYELEQTIEFKKYQEQKRQELLQLLTQNPHETEDIDSLYYQIQEGFYDEEQPIPSQTTVTDNTTEDLAESPAEGNGRPASGVTDTEAPSANVGNGSGFIWTIRLVHEYYPESTPEELFRLLSVSAAEGKSPSELIRKVLKCTEGQEHAARSYSRHGKSLFKWLIQNYDDGTLSAKFKDFLAEF